MENKTPIEMLAGLLAEMTTRAAEAERELAEVKKSEDAWYNSYLNLKVENQTLRNTAEGLQTDLNVEKAAHEKTKANLEKATQHLAYYIEGGAENDSE